MKRIFIVNSKAGHGQAVNISSYIHDVFYLDDDVIIIHTDDNISTINVAKYYKNENAVIYSVGGDGTLNDVINGLSGGRAYLGIIPCGSGNDFIRNIDLQTKDIDLGKVNDRYFINIVSFGIDAEVASKVNQLNKNGGSKHVYPKGIIKTFPKFKSPSIILEDEQKDITILSICNGSYYGNGIKLAPHANIDDGQFDLYLVEKLTKLEILYLFSKLLKGTHEKSKKVKYSHIKNLQVKSFLPIICNIDGEITKGKNFHISLQKEKINYYQEDNDDLKKLIYPFMKR